MYIYLIVMHFSDNIYFFSLTQRQITLHQRLIIKMEVNDYDNGTSTPRLQ